MAVPYRKGENLTDRSTTDPIDGTLNGPWIRDIIFRLDKSLSIAEPLLNRSQRHNPHRGLNQRLDKILHRSEYARRKDRRPTPQ